MYAAAQPVGYERTRSGLYMPPGAGELGLSPMIGIGISPFLGGAPSAAGLTPLVVMGAATVAWWRSDLGITIGTGVSSWADQSGNSVTLTQGTAANQPTFNATGGPNGRPSLLFDGVNDRLANAALDRPAPNVTPTFFWSVLRQIGAGWTINDRFWGMDGASAGRMIIFQTTATPQIFANNGASSPSNANLTVDTYKGLDVYFSGTTADYVQVSGTAPVTGNNCGTNDPGAGFSLGTAGNGTTPGNIEVCELAIFSALPSAAQLASLAAYRSALYGAL